MNIDQWNEMSFDIKLMYWDLYHMMRWERSLFGGASSAGFYQSHDTILWS